MSATHDLMDRVKERRGLTSDSALARLLGATQATVSNWRQGTRHPQPHYIEKMSNALGERAIVWALRIQAERDAKVDPTNSKVWLRWADEIGKSAAAILLVFGLAVYTPKASAFSGETPVLQNVGLYTLCEVVITITALRWELTR
ncbi:MULTISPECIES: helix-turn-helix domain-containing protein [Luteibacter]|uniref:helix-turn-helix domain-containing protein n=2 Tax=Luteibacter TaxID=242605 RepID=UPI0009E027BB